MGVFPLTFQVGWSWSSRPHARGGVSKRLDFFGTYFKSSPRPWGCFLGLVGLSVGVIVVPTPVGVFPGSGPPHEHSGRRPHARGGVSFDEMAANTADRSSPRPWGCFYVSLVPKLVRRVVPTPVGVFPPASRAAAPINRRPHARGGVSPPHCPSDRRPGSSPRPWGCFRVVAVVQGADEVVPTPVGVFPPRGAPMTMMRRRPHARGGVSDADEFSTETEKSSPRPWGCFCPRGGSSRYGWVVPTPVGVFPGSSCRHPAAPGRPHARGGVSAQAAAAARASASSPRPWGCFRGAEVCARRGRVVPTPVGVFPAP